MPMRESTVKIRRARQTDAPRIAELSGQLGYPTTPRAMAGRLKLALREKNGACFVAEKVRSQGAGWSLLRAAEEWARKRRCKGISLRSNVLRERAHGFYERHGYEHYKTQKAFRKEL